MTLPEPEPPEPEPPNQPPNQLPNQLPDQLPDQLLEPAPVDAPSRLRVLLVDDVADLRLLLRSLFVAYPGIEVVGEAGDGLEAIELAACLQPDLVVLDINMPRLDGVAALPRIRAAAPDCRVVMLSAIPRAVDPGALAAGAVAYVEKSAVSSHRLVEDILTGAGLLDTQILQPQPFEHAEASFEQHPASVGKARAFAQTTLGEGSEVLDTVQLLVSELVTNAIIHATSAPTLAIQLLARRVHVEIIDRSGSGLRPRDASGSDESGRGLQLVESLAESWGTIPVPDGKIVWFEVSR